MSNPQGKFTDAGEIGAYVLAHAAGLLWGFGVNPWIFRTLVAKGYRDLMLPSVALSIAVAAVVLLLFLFLRRMMTGGTQAAASGLPGAPAVPPPPTPAPLPVGALRPQAGPGAGSVLGIVSIVCGVIGLLPGFGLLAAMIGIALGWVGRRRALEEGDNRGAFLCLVGLVLASVMLVVSGIYLLLVGGAMLGITHF
jgi:hypothetical protein